MRHRFAPKPECVRGDHLFAPARSRGPGVGVEAGTQQGISTQHAGNEREPLMLKRLKNFVSAVVENYIATREWRGSSGETVAQRKARQESEKPPVLRYALREFKPKAEVVRDPKAKQTRDFFPVRESAASLRRKRWARLIASAAPSFRPLGSPLTMTVSKGLRWGHMSKERRIRLANLAARKVAA